MTSTLLFILSFLLTLQNAGSLAEGCFCQTPDNLTVAEYRCSVLPHRFSTTSTYSTTYVLHFDGFGGHEYLPWFGIYNANARLYDPLLGRFLSPDPYVQAPDFSVNFNRYVWCLNNPLNGKPLGWIGQDEDMVSAFEFGLKNEVARIKEGRLYPYKHDGTLFRNDKGFLPTDTTYTEYLVLPMNGPYPGAHRIVVGANNHWYYTPDHYKTFFQFKP